MVEIKSLNFCGCPAIAAAVAADVIVAAVEGSEGGL